MKFLSRWLLVESYYMWLWCNTKVCKIDKCLDINNHSWERYLFGKLLLTCQDNALNTTESSLDYKKREKKFEKKKKKKEKNIIF